VQHGSYPEPSLKATQLSGWTLADLDGDARPTPEHIGRALYLRKAISL
jgi:hypothetical protein